MGEVIRIIFQQLFIRGQFASMAHSYNVVIVHFAGDDTQKKGRVGLFFAGTSLALVCCSSKGIHIVI